MSVRLQKASTIITKYVWISNENSTDWLLCKVLEQNNSIMTLQDEITQNILTYDTAFTEVFQSNEHIVSDMTYLRHL